MTIGSEVLCHKTKGPRVYITKLLNFWPVKCNGFRVLLLNWWWWCNSICNSDTSRLGKANSVFSLSNFWKGKQVYLSTYKGMTMNLLFLQLPVWSGDWHMTVTNNKKLEAALDRWQRKVLGMCWKDKITNEEVRRCTGQEMLEIILFEEDSLDMYRDTARLVYQTLKWFHPIFKKKCVSLRMNWKKTLDWM